MNDLSDIQSELRERILPAMKLPSVDIRALMLYGSRSNGLHRPDSDYDLLAIVEDFPAGVAEYHGYLRIQGNPNPVELRVFSEHRLRQEMRKGPVHRAVAVASGIALWDPDGILVRMASKANARIARERAELQREIAEIVPDQYLSLLRIAFSEIRAIVLALARTRQATAAFARFSEALVDLHLASERLSIRCSGPDFDEGEVTRRLHAILLLGGPRPARFLDVRKLALGPWLNHLLDRLDSILVNADHSTTSHWIQIFNHLDRTFLERFGAPLLISRREECEAILREGS